MCGFSTDKKHFARQNVSPERHSSSSSEETNSEDLINFENLFDRNILEMSNAENISMKDAKRWYLLF